MAEVQRADLSIYGNLNTQKPMSLADMLNIGRSSLAYEKEKELYQSGIEQAKAQSKLAEITTSKAQALLEPEIAAGKAVAKGQELDFANKEAKIIFDEMNALAANPFIKNFDPAKANEAARALSEAKQRARDKGADPTKIDLMSAPLFNKILSGQGGTIHQGLLDSINTAQNTGQFGQVTGVTPTSTGQTTEFMQVSPFVKPQSVASIQQQLPPTTLVAGEQGQQTYLGPTGNQPQAPVVAAQGPMFQNQANLATKDWTETTAAQQEAANRIPVIQNIKKLAPEAFTGVGGARKELAAGILGAVGIDILTAEKTSTDELSKNAAILQLAGGNTDLARTIAEAANPNKKMTKEAIEGMANQLLGVEKLKQARYDYLKPFVNDPIKYNEKSAQFAKFADYRLFQEMTAQEVAKLKQSMSPAQQKEVSDKIREAKMLGIIR